MSDKKYRIVLRKVVVKFLEKHKWERIVNDFKIATDNLSKNPYENYLDIQSMVWVKNWYRLRLSKYRFMYKIMDDELIIHFIEANKRGDIY